MEKELCKNKIKNLEEDKNLLIEELKECKDQCEIYRENCKGLNKKIIELNKELRKWKNK